MSQKLMVPASNNITPIYNPPPVQTPRPYITGCGMLTAADETDYSTGNYEGWTNPYVTFVRGRHTWGAVQPSSGSSFNWASLDALFAQAHTYNKKISITIPGAGTNTPAWVYTAGATSFACHDRHENSTGNEPLPWDTVFQTKFFAMIDALGTRYANDPLLCNVFITGVAQAGDTNFGSLNDYTSVAAYKGSYATVDAAWTAGAQAIANHIRSVFVEQTIMINPAPVFPNNAGTLDQNNFVDFVVAQEPTRGGVGISAVFAHSNYGPPVPPSHNGISIPKYGQEVQPTWDSVHNIVNAACYNNTANTTEPQAFYDMTGNAAHLGNIGLEIYQSDLKNSQVQGVLPSVNAIFLANLPP